MRLLKPAIAVVALALGLVATAAPAGADGKCVDIGVGTNPPIIVTVCTP